MTIQISVLVWTIICFVLLMLILQNLLFKPVLELMDKRQERIRNAAAKKAEYEKLANEYESKLLEKKAAAYDEQKKKIKDEIETIRIDSKKAMEEAKELRLREVDDYRAKAKDEQAEILKELSTHTTELAVSFANSLIKE